MRFKKGVTLHVGDTYMLSEYVIFIYTKISLT